MAKAKELVKSISSFFGLARHQTGLSSALSISASASYPFSPFVQILSDLLMLRSSFQDAKPEYTIPLVTTGAFLFFFD